VSERRCQDGTGSTMVLPNGTALKHSANEYPKAILDARLAFKTVKGFAIHIVFATKEELEGWPKIGKGPLTAQTVSRTRTRYVGAGTPSRPRTRTVGTAGGSPEQDIGACTFTSRSMI
jgi:hypothetical protein